MLRAGRFDRQVLVDRPDKVGRAQILGVHRAVRILTDNRRTLEDGARQLLQKETLNEAEIGAIAAPLTRASRPA